MLYHLKEYGKYAEITGFQNVKFVKAEKFLKANRKETRENVDLQFFDASLIATKEHLYFAVLNALQAFHNKTNISKSLAMEVMLYASAQRQIQKAIYRCGIKPETTSMAVIIIGQDPTQLKIMLGAISTCVGVEPDEKVLEMSNFKEQKIIDTFQITDQELKSVMKNGNHEEALVNLVIEQVALLATQL
jgi:tRNA threonylcarbamoyladenosine modification (KEOPS) complex Cgi121 subunit